MILSLDLLFFERKVTDRLRGAVARLFDLKLNEILLNFTHTHAGPRCSEWHYTGKVDPVYLDKVEQGILAAVEQARQDVEPVDVWAGKTTTRLPVSRRWLDDRGLALWRPSPEAEVCNHLPFALFKTAQGRAKALLFSASCHPSMIHTNDVSAEWPGAAVRRLNAHFQTKGSVFLQGAAGDTKPRQIAAETQWRSGTWEEMEEAGKEVAAAVVAAASGTLEKVQPELRAISQETFWPLMAAPKREDLEAEARNAETAPGRRAWAADMQQRIALLGRSAVLTTG
ncbi:MAG: hypothetical protein IT578_07395 [Verrucomicrobiae bacterium]|nr:hypothetical protein [Verrucomicrobiae bacterium]